MMLGMGLLELLVLIGVPVLALALILRVLLWFTRSASRPAAGGDEVKALTERTAMLEEELHIMNQRLENLTASQEFTARLLTERKGAVLE